jgi:UDP-glucose 4-epimerase
LNNKKILVTGATGYIGSHVCVELILLGYDVYALDNLSNSSVDTIDRIQKITGHRLKFFHIDICDEASLLNLFSINNFDAVIHLAGFKAVKESVSFPLQYFYNNVSGSINLLKCLEKYHINKIIFSSSATVYGVPQSLPIKEDARLSPVNPYGRSKLMVETILSDLLASSNAWQIGILRYFNPVGAHSSGLIGESPLGIPNNLMPYISRVAVGGMPVLNVFGNDYSTHDGTGVRDYIHVEDLARGHIAALEYLFSGKGSFTVNLGTGIGFSVLDVIKAFELASGRTINFVVKPRREGDIDSCYADATKAKQVLSWVAKKNLHDMCFDSWHWQIKSQEK